MRLEHSIFENQTDDKIVHKDKGELRLDTHKVIKVGDLAVISQKHHESLKKYTFLLTADRLYYVKSLDKTDTGDFILKYQADIRLEWLTTIFYTRKSEEGSGVRYYIEIVRLRKAVILCCDELMEYESWVSNLSRLTIQTNFKAKYSLKEMIGEGATSKVHVVLNRGDNKTFACKKFKKRYLVSSKTLSGLINEITILRLLKGHPNIVELEEIQETTNSVYLILENLKGGRVTSTEKRYHASDIRHIAVSVLHGLVSIHDLGIVHRDLKPGNILLKHKNTPIHQNVIKIIDFGISSISANKHDYYKKCGTVGYLPPETFVPSLRNGPSPKSDIYTLGVILYNAYMGVKLFDRTDESDAFKANKIGEINFSYMCDREFPPKRRLNS